MPSSDTPPANAPTNTPVSTANSPTTIDASGNFPAAIAAGFVAALIGAAIWAAVTVATEYQIGWMAVGVGFLVGIAVRAAGKGSGDRFAYAGAVLALLGCVLGNLFTVVALFARQTDVGFFAVLARLRPGSAVDMLSETFQPMDLLFYGIAVYGGFKASRVPPAQQ